MYENEFSGAGTNTIYKIVANRL